MVLDLFEEAHEQAKTNVYTPAFEVIEQAYLKTFLFGDADDLLDEKMYRLAESKSFIQGLVHHLIQLSTSTVPVARFLGQQAKKAVASEARFRQDMSRRLQSGRK